ncbi:c-type cytochrome [Kordiimonas sp.]|uniref:c-type cytochrome n=1 Tax=Kordiimonas sp. TaxID=1970157 RepID=UPI003A943AB0
MSQFFAAAMAVGMTSPLGATDLEAGAKLYKRCAACHLADGAGVPGAFPPLTGKPAAWFTEKEARQYLVMVLNKGLAGKLEVAGVTYRGIMPAQGSWLKDEGTAETLNYVMMELNGATDARPFSAEEVANIKSTMAGQNARTLMQLRPQADAESEAAK